MAGWVSAQPASPGTMARTLGGWKQAPLNTAGSDEKAGNRARRRRFRYVGCSARLAAGSASEGRRGLGEIQRAAKSGLGAIDAALASALVPTRIQIPQMSCPRNYLRNLGRPALLVGSWPPPGDSGQDTNSRPRLKRAELCCIFRALRRISSVGRAAHS